MNNNSYSIFLNFSFDDEAGMQHWHLLIFEYNQIGIFIEVANSLAFHLARIRTNGSRWRLAALESKALQYNSFTLIYMTKFCRKSVTFLM